MKLHPECVPCLLGRVTYEANLIAPDKAFEVLRECCKILARGSSQVVSADIATEVHRKAYAILESKDPYAEVKIISNETALSLRERAREIIESSKDALRTAAICSIAGNVLDFGIRGSIDSPEKLGQVFNDIVNQGVAVDHIDQAKQLMKPGARILYFTDNCGEIIFDDLLIRQIRKLGCVVTVVVKGAPILTDATMDDVWEYNISGDFFLTTCSNAVGLAFNEIDERLKQQLDQADLIVSKGMANYESFSDTEYRPILYLMRTKCQPIADSIDEPKDASIAKLFS